MPDFAVKTTFLAIDKMSPAFMKMNSEMSKFGNKGESIFARMGTIAGGIIGARGIESVVSGLKNFVVSSVDAARNMQRLETAFDSVFQSDAGKQMAFVRDETNRLGLEFMRSAEAYKGIAASAKGTAINNKQVQETFLGVAEASSALQLTGEQTEGALLAISQIISKGKVSMEELRGQLGERIPGAMQIAARSMGVTSAEMEKLVASGISAEVFIPKFAAQMRKEFGPAAMESAKSFNAAANRFSNLVNEMKVAIGTTLLPVLNDFGEALTPVLKDIAMWARENKTAITETVREIVKWIPRLVIGFVAWKAALVGAWLWSKLVILETYGLANGLKILMSTTRLAAAAQLFLNFAMLANPIIFVIAAIAALVGWVTIAIINWDSWGESMLNMLGPVGMVINMFKKLYDSWEFIKQSFSEGGLWEGLKSMSGVVMDKGYAKDMKRDPFSMTGDKNEVTAPNETEVQGGLMNMVKVIIKNYGDAVKSEVTTVGGKAEINKERYAEGYQ